MRIYSRALWVAFLLVVLVPCTDAEEKAMTDSVFRWAAREPTRAKDAGYPHLPGVEIIHLLKDQVGQMNHHPMLQRLSGRFYLMTTHHPLHHAESSRGRNCIAWISDEDGKKWTGPLELLLPPDEVTDELNFRMPKPEKHPIGFPVRFVETSDGQVYGVSRIGYKKPIRNGPGVGMNSHHTVGYLARSIASGGRLGEQFWIRVVENPADNPNLQYPDRSDTPLAREIAAVAWAWTPEGGGLSPQGIRYPKPWRQQAPDGVHIAEYSTARTGDRAVCLARVNNTGREPLHYMAWSDDDGETWGPMQRTNIPSAWNWSHIGKLPDGRLYILGSLNRTRARQPLAIAVSDDGTNFTRVWSVWAEKIHAVRNSIVHEGYIWAGICHGGEKNHGRQDVAIVKIPIKQLR